MSPSERARKFLKDYESLCAQYRMHVEMTEDGSPFILDEESPDHPFPYYWEWLRDDALSFSKAGPR
jgi:hypothetical protein